MKGLSRSRRSWKGGEKGYHRSWVEEKETKRDGFQRRVFESLSNLLNLVICRPESARVTVISRVCRSIFIEVRYSLIVGTRCYYIWKVKWAEEFGAPYRRQILLGQDDKKWQDRDERPAAPGRLIVKDKSRKGEGRLSFAPAGLKKRCTRGASENSFFCVFSPFFFGDLYHREDVPATLATLPAGGCHRHRER